MPEHADELFAEYADAYARGERPAAREFLVRAGNEADELSGRIDAFLVRAPAPAADNATVELFDAWRSRESPLLRLRTARGLARDTLVAALVRVLRLDVKKAWKVRRYYDELEAGRLEPGRVDGRVWEVLAEELGTRVADLVSWRPLPPPVLGAARFAGAARPTAAMAQADVVDQDDEDEIDRLFTRRTFPAR